MGDFFLVLLIVSITMFFIGLVKPTLVLRWIPESNRNRMKVVSSFGPIILISFILFGITIESP